MPFSFSHIEDMDIAEKYPYLFQAAAFHTQDPATVDNVYQYPTHRDKAGKITAFYQSGGWSFNFIAVQHRSLTVAQFCEDNGYQQYLLFKYNANDKDCQKMDKFERHLFKEANEGSFPCPLIKVIPLFEGDYIIFDATLYHHGTIILRQKDPRSYVIFHDLKQSKKKINVIQRQ